MIHALSLAFGDLLDPRVRGVVAKVALFTGLAFVVLAVVVWWAAGFIDPIAYANHEYGLGWLDTPVGWLVDAAIWVANLFLGVFDVLVFLALLWLGFVIVAQNVAGLFLDQVVDAVEARHYPGLPPVSQTFRQVIAAGFNLTVMVIVVNLLVLPAYLLLSFLPPANLVLFYLVNGYLFGREYFETVVFRREQGVPAAARWRARRGTWILGGAAIAFLMTIPIVNFVAPIVGAAFFTHLVNRRPA